MSKIKVNELEAKTDNTNIKLTPVGTGVVEVKGAGGNDGTVEFKTLQGNNGVKLKSPPHSAQQSYTLTLPDNNVEADKFLRVKSITGSGNTATGQLECATIAATDLTQLNASNLTSGTLANSVLPTSFAATGGAGLQLISRTVITSGQNIYYLDYPNLDDNTVYRLVIKKLMYASQLSGSSGMRIQLFDSNGNVNIGTQNIQHQHMGEWSSWYTSSGAGSLNVHGGPGNSHNFTGVFEWNTRASTGWGAFEAMYQGGEENFCYGYFGTQGTYGNHPRLYGLRFSSDSGYLVTDADVLLYKYVEA